MAVSQLLSSLKAFKPGSPVRSLGWRVMLQPVVVPIRLLPNDVTPAAQSAIPPPVKTNFFQSSHGFRVAQPAGP
jgi:hypothetical protein